MKIYSYRPPRIRQADFDVPPTHNTHKIFIPIFLILGAVVGFHFIPAPEMISAVISEEGVPTGSVQRAQAEENLPLNQMKPFLKVSQSNWKLQNTAAQQAIGGGPGILKEALDLKGAISVNYDTGEVYYSQNSAARMRIASITKLMTSMVAMDLVSMDEKFTVEQAATEVEPTVIGVRVGDQLTTRELIEGGLLTSGNDAMAVLAEGVGKKYSGDTTLFIAAMNEKAKQIGMKNTQFDNPQGYDGPNHYSTVEDVVYMARYALKNYPELAKIVTRKDTYLEPTTTHRGINLPNWNMLINTYPGADGVKIGNTGEAGHTTVASSTRNGKRVLAVVLGAEGILERDMSAAELLNVGFASLGITPFPMTEDILRERIKDWY